MNSVTHSEVLLECLSVREQFLTGTLAHNRLFSAIQLWMRVKSRIKVLLDGEML